MKFATLLKPVIYLLYTRCNHSEQVLPYRMEPTFIQTCHSLLNSQVLEFTHTNEDRVYWIDSSIKSLDHLTDNHNWPFKLANKVIVNVFS